MCYCYILQIVCSNGSLFFDMFCITSNTFTAIHIQGERDKKVTKHTFPLIAMIAFLFSYLTNMQNVSLLTLCQFFFIIDKRTRASNIHESIKLKRHWQSKWIYVHSRNQLSLFTLTNRCWRRSNSHKNKLTKNRNEKSVNCKKYALKIFFQVITSIGTLLNCEHE